MDTIIQYNMFAVSILLSDVILKMARNCLSENEIAIGNLLQRRSAINL